MSLDQEYRDAKGKLVDFETRIKNLESDNRQSNQALGFILQLQREQVIQSDRVYGWLAALFDALRRFLPRTKPQRIPFMIKAHSLLCPSLNAVLFRHRRVNCEIEAVDDGYAVLSRL